MMTFFRRRQHERVPHLESGFDQAEYVEEYSEVTGKIAGADFDKIIRHTLEQHRDHRTIEVLDLGCGPGWLGIRLAKVHAEARVTGVDLSEEFIVIANRNGAHEEVDDRVDFQTADATALTDLESGRFDAVISNQSLHYWNPPEAVFDEIYRLLKPGGSFCLGTDRRDLTWLGWLEMRFGLLLHTSRIGESWRRSVAGCYTLAELEEKLENSRLRSQWSMQVGGRMLMVCGRRRSD